jgi:hypothetical protein
MIGYENNTRRFIIALLVKLLYIFFQHFQVFIQYTIFIFLDSVGFQRKDTCRLITRKCQSTG